MITIASILAMTLAMPADDPKAGALVPIEQGVTDRSATATSLRIMPVELSETTNFQKLFGVVGRPDLLVRSQGGVYAVFDQGSYRVVQGRTFVQWPSGTTFCIGRPDFSNMKSGGVRGGQISADLPPGIALPQKSSGGPDMRIGEPPVDTRIRAQPINDRIIQEPANAQTKALVPVKDVGFGHHSVGPIDSNSATVASSPSTQDKKVSSQPTPSAQEVIAPTPSTKEAAPPTTTPTSAARTP